jgi:thiol-disulfide isomerase/thioredoxin
MIRKLIFIVFILMLVGSQLKPNNNFFFVEMNHVKFDSLFFEDKDYYFSSLAMKNFERYPLLEKKIKTLYKGIPLNDSIGYYICFKDYQFDYTLLDSGDLTKENYYGKIRGEDIDTLNFSKVKLKSEIISIIGFYKNKQFMIADANRNKDFSDDIKYEYDIDFRKDPHSNIDLIDKQPITEYSFEDCTKGNIQVYNRRFVIYPDINNPFSVSNKNPKKERQYFSVLKFRDFWQGETTINNKKIEFYFHGYRNTYGIIYVKPKEISFKKGNENFNGQFRHNLADTLSIAGSLFMLDSINSDISKLYLREIRKKENNYGNVVGEEVKNFKYLDLNNKKNEFKDILNQKKYTLLEFWGTWCGPCIAMTPKLKEINSKYSKKLNILSIANDNLPNIKKYILKNKMNWKFGYIPEKKPWENELIKQLKVNFYPTFILLNSKGEILSRGNTDSFDEMVSLIQ